MIEKLIKKYKASVIAKVVDESPQVVNNWSARGVVPLRHAVNFCAAVNFEITPHLLFPNNYPNPDDALPSNRRCDCVPTTKKTELRKSLVVVRLLVAPLKRVKLFCMAVLSRPPFPCGKKD